MNIRSVVCRLTSERTIGVPIDEGVTWFVELSELGFLSRVDRYFA